MLKTKIRWRGVISIALQGTILMSCTEVERENPFIPLRAQAEVSVAIASLDKVAEDRYEIALTTTNSSSFPVCLAKRAARNEISSFPYRASDRAIGAGETVSPPLGRSPRPEAFKLLPNSELSQVVWFAPSEMTGLIRDDKLIQPSSGLDDYYMQLDVYIFDCKFDSVSEASMKNAVVMLRTNRSNIVTF
jgi:hypothetical protein